MHKMDGDSCTLSAQCTDKRVNMVTPALYARYPDAASLAGAETAELESMIRSTALAGRHSAAARATPQPALWASR